MKFSITFSVTLLLSNFLQAQSPSVTVIKNINVIDVKKGKVQNNMSVIIKGELITDIVPTRRLETDGTTVVIDGSGKYLMPGMTDAHIHFFQSGGLFTRPDGFDFTSVRPYDKERQEGFNNTEDYLRRYLRCGITTVADMGGPLSNFKIRDSIARTFNGPDVLVTGSLFSNVSNPKLDLTDPIVVKTVTKEDADLLLDKLLEKKPDYIKVWYIITPDFPAEKGFEVVKHIAERTHKAGLKLAVHATEAKTAELAVDAGADILVHSVDDQVFSDQFTKKLVTKKVSYIPTLIVSSNWYKSGLGKLDNHPHELRWSNPFIYSSTLEPLWIPEDKWPANFKGLRSSGMVRSSKTTDSIMAVNLKKVFSSGVNVVTGTDAGNPGTMHASSYFKELEAMKRAGLSNAEIIRAATLNASTLFNNNKGLVEKGKTADLLLLTKNPLEQLDNLNTIEIVVKSGRTIPADSIVKETPEMLVQRQVVAYNAGNIDAFLDTYSDEIELFNFPDSLMAKGKDAMRKIYEPLFKNPGFKPVQIVNRITLANKIMDHESLVYNGKKINAIAVYEVKDGKITRVTFIR
ncbi:amidohydrolase family protein [Chryseosolibacter indicus]|uniref:Amidohydrolase family protein n=1 Tax=Chryseosolibacter indicus TaxID=2782351 RepID=A0ABS5VL76_9BACT|nr:amidohydrolase family protein [Chryseosolibacter indicus]MBT1702205.1 amidohydrolase family protein [Chryseosolibacter indicus]